MQPEAEERRSKSEKTRDGRQKDEEEIKRRQMEMEKGERDLIQVIPDQQLSSLSPVPLCPSSRPYTNACVCHNHPRMYMCAVDALVAFGVYDGRQNQRYDERRQKRTKEEKEEKEGRRTLHNHAHIRNRHPTNQPTKPGNSPINVKIKVTK